MVRRKKSLITDSFLLRLRILLFILFIVMQISFWSFLSPAWFSCWKIANFADSVIYVSVWDSDFFCGSILYALRIRIGARMDEKKQFGAGRWNGISFGGWELPFSGQNVCNWEKDGFSGIFLHLPLLVPSGPLKIVHSSIEPNAPNSCLTSSSFCCLLNMPTKSFRSYYLS